MRNPSSVLVVGFSASHVNVLHVVPEDGALEHSGSSHRPATPFRCGAATERRREQRGTLCLHVGDGETAT